ncbi:MAG TPA: type II secretion system protein GspL [Gammaproteobacteria bacterium]|nr:type II secretion system protein GspL [Gammaproteobacteria bacterium]
MAAQVHLRLLSLPGQDTLQACWIRIDDGNIASDLKLGSLASAADDLAGDAVIVHVPGEDVLLTQVRLPDNRRKQLIKALPYALEDDLIDDVDSLHCVLGSRIEPGLYNAAVVAHEKMRYWLDLLETAGIRVLRVLPDTLLLPFEKSSWTVFSEHNPDQVLVRTDLEQGFVCSRENLITFIQKAAAQEDRAQEKIRLFHCESIDESALEVAVSGLSELEWIDEPQIEDALSLLSLKNETTDFNLLQGRYAPHSRIGQYLRPWYSSAALLGFLLVIGLAANIIQYYSLQAKNKELERNIIATFRQAFPEVKRVVNPQAQMRHHLSRLRGSNKQGLSFAEMLSTIAPLAKSTKGLKIQNLHYQKGQMELQIELPDLQTLESFKQTLSSRTPWKVELKSANSTDNKVQGRMVIYEK